MGHAQARPNYAACLYVPYFLEISPHLEIPPPSKSRRTHKEVGSNKRRPRNLAAWKRVVGFKVRGMQAREAESDDEDPFADIDSEDDEELENNEILVDDC